MVNFVNVFLTYVVQFLVICVVSGAAITIGITMAKKKNGGASSEAGSAEDAGKA